MEGRGSKTVVYLSDDRIQVVVGTAGAKATIKRYAVTTDISACMMNGTVVDKEGFCAHTAAFFKRHDLPVQNVTLVVDSNQIVTRTVKVPIKNENETLAFVANEFSEVERAQNPLYAYMVLSTDKKAKLNEVLAIMADGDFVRGQVELFAQCGVTVTAVESALACAIRAIDEIVDDGHVDAVQLMGDTGFDSLLFSKGEYLYSTHNSLFNEHGTEAFGVEVARSINSLSQFAITQQLEGGIEDILLAGFSDDDLRFATEAIENMVPGVAVKPLPAISRVSVEVADVPPADCIYVAGTLLGTGKTANLMRGLATNKGFSGGLTGNTRRFVILFGILVAVLLVIFLALLAVRIGVQGAYKKAVAYDNDPAVLEQVAIADELLAERSALNQKIGSITRLESSVATYPQVGSSVNNQLAACANGLADVEIGGYDSMTGELLVSAYASDVDRINGFITALRNDAAFEVQDYSGYEYIASRGQWNVHVSVFLTADEGEGVR